MWGSEGTVETASTGAQKRDHHRLPWVGEGHVWPGLFDDPGRFMASHHRQMLIPVPPNQMHVAVTDAHRLDAYFHFTLLGGIDSDVFNHQGGAMGITDSCFHRNLLTL